MEMETKSSIPIIVSIDWGNIQIQIKNHQEGKNRVYNFKDVVLEPTAFYEWNFKEGFNSEVDTIHTSHQYKKDMSKGIQPHSVRHLLSKGNVFVLTTGFNNDLGVNKATIKFLKDNGKQVIVVNSKDTKNIYNSLIKKGNKVVALVHSTC